MLWIEQMICVSRFLGLIGAWGIVSSCAVSPPVNPKIPGPEVRHQVIRRVSAVIVTQRKDLVNWVNEGFSAHRSPGDADGGSATPISPDGYFLTADHVVAGMEGRNVFVLHGKSGQLVPSKARVVWRSKVGDLALLKISGNTPDYYHWSAPDRWLPVGTPVTHGGIATGFKAHTGRLSSSLPPESGLSGTRKFKLDIPLQPGDSGGPVVDADGGLIGINSAVEFLVPMETAFFVDSEANRPNIRALEALIQADRSRIIPSTSGVN